MLEAKNQVKLCLRFSRLEIECVKKISENVFWKGVMKTSVKTDVDSVDSVNGRCPRSTVDQTDVFYWSTLINVNQ